MSIGQNIRRLREEKGLTQGCLAEQIGITQSMLCQLERGTKAPSLPLSMEIAQALGCRLEDLTPKHGE